VYKETKTVEALKKKDMMETRKDKEVEERGY